MSDEAFETWLDEFRRDYGRSPQDVEIWNGASRQAEARSRHPELGGGK